MSNACDFIIKNGVLTKYVGPGGDVVIPEGVTSVGYWGFFDNKKLKSVRVPESVTYIGHYAFSECQKLEFVAIMGRSVSFGTDLFENSGEPPIIAPNIPVDNLKNAKMLFQGACGYLREPECYQDEQTVAAYRKYIFSQKKKILPYIFAADLVYGVVEFATAGKITAKNFETDFLQPAMAAEASQCVAYLLEWGNKNIPALSVEKKLEREISKDPLNTEDMKKLWVFEKLADGSLEITGYKGTEVDLIIPERIGKNTVTAIGPEAFYHGRARRPKVQGEVLKSIKTIVLPESITMIGDRAFMGCKKLKSIQIPEKATIGTCAFLGCTKLADTDGFVRIQNRLFDYAGSGGETAIPEDVVAIEPFAFQQNKKISTVTIPASVISIGRNAFEKCYNLQSVNIPPQVTEIGEETFCWCKNLIQVRIDGTVTSIRDRAFYGCEKLIAVSLSTAAIVDSTAFCKCESLADRSGFVILRKILFGYYGRGGYVTIPDGVTEISSSAFEGRSDLTTIIIPDSMAVIGSFAFRDCIGLASVPIPESVTEIGEYAFWGCSNLTIHAPIGSYAESYAKENNIPFVAE